MRKQKELNIEVAAVVFVFFLVVVVMGNCKNQKEKKHYINPAITESIYKQYEIQ